MRNVDLALVCAGATGAGAGKVGKGVWETVLQLNVTFQYVAKRFVLITHKFNVQTI